MKTGMGRLGSSDVFLGVWHYVRAMNAPRIFRMLHVDGPSRVMPQSQWSDIIEAASCNTPAFLAMTGVGELDGNVVSFSEADPAWLAVFAQTASNFGIPTVFWADASVTRESAALLKGMGVVHGSKVSLAGLRAADVAAALVGASSAGKEVFGTAPTWLHTDVVDRLVLQEARRAGYARIVRDGSGINTVGARVISCREARDASLESAWLRGELAAAIRVARQGVSLNKLKARLML